MNTRTHKCPKSSTNGNHIFEYYYDGNDNFIGDAEDCKLCGIGYGYDIDRGFVEVKWNADIVAQKEVIKI